MSGGGGPSVADRARYVLVSYFSIFLALCLLLALGGAFVAYGAHTGPETTTERRAVGTWTTDGGFEHGAVVQRDSLAFDEGEVVQNRSVYFGRVTPILNGSYVIDHEGDADAASFRTNLTLLVRAVEVVDDREVVLWELSEDVGGVESTDLAPGERHRVPFEVNVTERAVTAAAIQEELDSNLGRAEVLLLAETEATADLAGDAVGHVRRDRLEVSAQERVHRVASPESDERTESVSEPVEVPVETDPIRAYGSIAAALLGLLGGAALLGLRRTDRLDIPAATEADIRSARERDSFAEWISEGRVPPTADGERVIRVDSLEDLVDVGIDSDRRVIEDGETGEFVVFDGSTRYVFRSDAGDGSALDSPGGSAAGRAPGRTADGTGSDDGDEPEAGDLRGGDHDDERNG